MIFKVISAVVFWLAISFLFSLLCLLSWCGNDIISAKEDTNDIEKVILRNFDGPFTFLVFYLLSPFLFAIVIIYFSSSKLIRLVSMALHILIVNKRDNNGGSV